MPINLPQNIPAAVVAKASATFASLGLNATNISIIFQVGNPLKSWMPGRAINPITGFEAGKGYYIIPAADLDLTAVLIPPVPTGDGEAILTLT